MGGGLTLPPAHEAALTGMTGQLREEFGDDLVGLLVAGSSVTGQRREHSDIDLYVIIRPLRRQRRTRHMAGVEFELFVNPPERIEREVGDVESATTHMFATGVVLADADGTMARLQAAARESVDRGPDPAAPIPALLHRYMPYDLLNDLHDVVPLDPAQAELLIADTARAARDAFYAAARRRRPKPKYEVADLEEAAPHLAWRLRLVLDVELPLANRVAVLAELVAAATAPLGGPLHDWETPWQEVGADGAVGEVLADG